MKNRIKLKLVVSLIMTVFVFSFFSPTSVQISYGQGTYDFADDSGLNITADNAGYDPNSRGVTIEERVSKIITVVLVLLGVLFLGLVIYGGVAWMTAFGNQEKVENAVEILTEAVVGFIVVFAAYGISWFVFNYFINNSLTP